MSDVAGVRKMIQVEETAYASAVSSSVATRVGAGINFINLNQHTDRSWVLNGNYGITTGSQEGVDGALPVFRDMEIIGFFMFNYVAGSAGTTEIDIIRHTASGAGTTIFTVTPKISYTAGNQAYMEVWYDPSETLENPAGTTLPTFLSRNLDKGDALTLNFVTRQTNAESLTITLATRPR